MGTPWDRAAGTFRAALRDTVGTETLKRLHRIEPRRHLAVALRQLAVLAIAVAAILLRGERWWVWIPASLAIGAVVFSMTVLLHEVVHKTVFATRRPRAARWLGHLYALPSGLSRSQFERWHLDHHDHLGTEDADPKRRWLTPHGAGRLGKALFLTPALFPIYFRAARCAAAAYPEALRRRIARERRAAILFHLAVPVAIALTGGLALAAKLHLVPVLVVFPVLFTVNRLGQHYDVDPDDPAKWATLIRPSPFFWDPLYLWSNHHLEHHYFPRVPFYNLPALHRALGPFFAARGIRPRTYGGLLFDWFVRGRRPHTRWHTPAPAAPATSTGAAAARDASLEPEPAAAPPAAS